LPITATETTQIKCKHKLHLHITHTAR